MDKAERFRDLTALEEYLSRWHLRADGDAITTPSSRLLPVICTDGMLAMLKIAVSQEERLGNELMAWWDGVGAARVLEQHGNAILLERACGANSLVKMSRCGRDSEASRIICDVAAKLHATRRAALPKLVPLDLWFAELEPAALRRGGVLRESLEASRRLLAEPRDIVVLHGDLHHGNVLDFGERGWLAIDPKGLIGERAFDFANILCNPDTETAAAPGRLAAQASVVAGHAHLDRTRLLQWILAYAGLSAAWSLSEAQEDARCALAIAEVAAIELKV